MQSAFVADDVSNIIKESVDAVLQNQQYNEPKVWLQARRGRAHMAMHTWGHRHAQA